MDDAERRAITALGELAQLAVDDVEAVEGGPLDWAAQVTLRAYIARAFEAGKLAGMPTPMVPGEPDEELDTLRPPPPLPLPREAREVHPLTESDVIFIDDED